MHFSKSTLLHPLKILFIQCLVNFHIFHTAVLCIFHIFCAVLPGQSVSLHSYSLFLPFSWSSPSLLLLLLLHLLDHIGIVFQQLSNFGDEQIQLYWDLTVQRDFRESLSPSELQRLRGDNWLVAVMQLFTLVVLTLRDLWCWPCDARLACYIASGCVMD